MSKINDINIEKEQMRTDMLYNDNCREVPHTPTQQEKEEIRNDILNLQSNIKDEIFTALKVEECYLDIS